MIVILLVLFKLLSKTPLINNNMKLAHLILAHANPKQVERLVARLSNENSHVFIHLDKKADITQYQYLNLLPGVFFISNRVAVGWGDYSMIQATLNGFEEILQKGIEYSHLNLLSGQDYPIKNIEEIQKFLFANAGKSFFQWRDIEKDWPDGRKRLSQYSLGDYHLPGKYQFQRFLNFLSKRKFPDNLKAYGKSQWVTITPAAAEYSIKYIKEHPKLKRFFRMTWAVDEVFFQSILVNSPLIDTLVNENYRYIEMDANLRPTTLVTADVKMLINSGMFFARKFDLGTDKNVFDELDKATDNIDTIA